MSPMWPQTRITKMLKIKYPIIQAPMAGGITSPELVAAVSNAGGLGSLAAGYMSPDEIRNAIINIRALTNKPFGVNLFIPEKPHTTKKQINGMIKILNKVCKPFETRINQGTDGFSFEDQIIVLIEEKIPVFSFTFGLLEKKWLKKFKNNKTKIIGTATSVAEAKILERHGIDLIVAQGYEAGGHRGNFLGNPNDSLIGNMALIPQIVDNVTIPIIAAGGIMDARGILAATLLGVDAIQMGTAFITCKESGAHISYKKALLKAKHDNTILTRSFSGKLARGIKNKYIELMEPYQDKILDYPIQHHLTQPIRKMATKNGVTNFMSLWSGQAAYLSQELTASQLIQSLNKNIEIIIKKINQ